MIIKCCGCLVAFYLDGKCVAAAAYNRPTRQVATRILESNRTDTRICISNVNNGIFSYIYPTNVSSSYLNPLLFYSEDFVNRSEVKTRVESFLQVSIINTYFGTLSTTDSSIARREPEEQSLYFVPLYQVPGTWYRCAVVQRVWFRVT
jgi:hypothetical protein